MTKKPQQGFYNMYRPIHSDFIIHWTGKKDIDDVYDETSEKLLELPAEVKFPEDLKYKISYDNSQKLLIFTGIMSEDEKEKLLKLSQGELYKKAIEALFQNNNWTKKNSSKTSPKATELYIERLKNILKYGLWMTKNDEDNFVIANGKTIRRPPVARTCFTELKLSEVRAHAARFGRLGIGVKRPFLFDRLGSPMCYFHPNRRNWFFEPCLSEDDEGEIKAYYSCFLKQMGDEPPPGGTWQYIYFDESEWRIIYSDKIRNLLLEKNRTAQYPRSVSRVPCLQLKDVVKLFENPRDKENKEYHRYYNTLTGAIKPEYLIPLDAWFSMIIYPSLDVKNKAQDNRDIRELIKLIKKDKFDRCIKVERKNYPIEVDLDACRNF